MLRLIRFAVSAVLVVSVCCPEVHAGKYNVAGNVFASTLMIQTSNGQGTGFTVDVDGRQYLITARHLVNGMGSEGIVKIGKLDGTNKIVFENETMKIFSCTGSIDIAVLIPAARLTVGEMDPESPDGFIVGQDAYFVGFPFGMYSNPKYHSGSLYPIGVVKHGLVSGVQYQSAEDGDLIILDGYNIFGFSGAPVTYSEPANGTTPARSYVIGVISGFNADSGLVVVPKEIRRQDIKPEDLERGRILEQSGHIYRVVEKKSMGNERAKW